ncbi:MAG: OmpA family protein [Ignavibacteriales bacterium]|nr:OmpA family protein [Ignavibacteriales bacterium]
MNKIILFVLLFIYPAIVLQAQYSSKRIYHPFTGTMVFTVEGGATYTETDYTKPLTDLTGRASLEYYLPFYSKSSFGIKLLGGGGYFKGRIESPFSEYRTSFSYVGGQVIYSIQLGKILFPYFGAGASLLWFDPRDGDNKPLLEPNTALNRKNEMQYNAEVGVKFALTDNISLNLGAMAHVSPNDRLDGKIKGTNNDIFFSGIAGFSVAFFGGSDEDNDGIEDEEDMCPGTPRGVRIDANGCPLDSDKDGVPDYRDNCAETPDLVKTDKHGCPVDTDYDSVPDYLDICAGTPRGVAVDEYGCPKDSDNDGIADYLDNCPNTVKGTIVDKSGCPLDSDGDGVADNVDQCPNTPFGVQVDATGCTLKKEEEIKEVPVIREVPVEKQTVLSAGASFAAGKAVLSSGAYEPLDKLIAAMKENTNTNWIIEGHTDSQGKYESNKKLSLERAKAVLKYFVSKGIKKERFTVRGLGPDFPVADNKTEAGRTKNRRVVIIRVD